RRDSVFHLFSRIGARLDRASIRRHHCPRSRAHQPESLAAHRSRRQRLGPPAPLHFFRADLRRRQAHAGRSAQHPQPPPRQPCRLRRRPGLELPARGNWNPPPAFDRRSGPAGGPGPLRGDFQRAVCQRRHGTHLLSALLLCAGQYDARCVQPHPDPAARRKRRRCLCLSRFERPLHDDRPLWLSHPHPSDLDAGSREAVPAVSDPCPETDLLGNAMTQTVLSGLRPTGRVHLGNYFGAVKNWVDLQNSGLYRCFFFIADLHALTTDYADTESLAGFTRDAVLDWLAVGLDPKKSTIFLQSRVPQHAELALYFSMITPLGWLERVPTYKDQIEQLRGKDLATHGFLGYPVLMTADIAVYRSQLVPVGEDQASHLEICREIVRRFNGLYGEVFPEPKALYTPTPKVNGIDGRKMSKSYGNTIGVTEAAE